MIKIKSKYQNTLPIKYFKIIEAKKNKVTKF